LRFTDVSRDDLFFAEEYVCHLMILRPGSQGKVDPASKL
jgi:hypothetical protein